MDPKGQFVEAFGQDVSVEEVGTKINEAVGQWQKEKKKKLGGIVLKFGEKKSAVIIYFYELLEKVINPGKSRLSILNIDFKLRAETQLLTLLISFNLVLSCESSQIFFFYIN